MCHYFSLSFHKKVTFDFENKMGNKKAIKIVFQNYLVCNHAWNVSEIFYSNLTGKWKFIGQKTIKSCKEVEVKITIILMIRRFLKIPSNFEQDLYVRYNNKVQS